MVLDERMKIQKDGEVRLNSNDYMELGFNNSDLLIVEFLHDEANKAVLMRKHSPITAPRIVVDLDKLTPIT